ncbi:hypothetical protein L7F22_068847, partial [Adiantum nelumboides]|nr:hypothetical protein [Adiantum nelumboides]
MEDANNDSVYATPCSKILPPDVQHNIDADEEQVIQPTKTPTSFQSIHGDRETVQRKKNGSANGTSSHKPGYVMEA